MSKSFCCEVCSGTNPKWTIVRRGDVVVSWACDMHLAIVCERLQRDFEVTELVITNLQAKAVEVAEINRRIRAEMPRGQ